MNKEKKEFNTSKGKDVESDLNNRDAKGKGTKSRNHGFRRAGGQGKKGFDEVKKSNWLTDNANAKAGAAVGSAGNDIAWWSKVPELLENAAVMKSNFIPGTDLFQPGVSRLGSMPIPGVVSIAYEHAYGTGGNPTSAINLMARDLFLKQFRKYRGISNYQAADMMMAIIAGVEVVSMVAHLERIYGVANYFQRRNQNVPYAILEALGISYNDALYIQSHLADFRYSLNLLIRKATKVCVPKDMSVLADRISLDGYLYLDHADASVAQIIAFRPVSWGLFLEGTKTPLKTGSTISFVRPTSSVLTNTPVFTTTPGVSPIYGTTLFPLLECMIDNLLSDSVQQIYGNLLTWFGEDQLITMLPFSDDFICAPVYSESILHKIHNMEVRYSDYITIENNSGDRVVGTGLPTGKLTDLVRVPGVYEITVGNDSTHTIFEYNSLYQLDGIIYSKPLLIDEGLQEYSLSGSYTGYPLCSATPTDPDQIGCQNVIAEAPHILDTYRENFDIETVTEGSLFKYHVNIMENNSNVAAYITSCAFEIIVSVTTIAVANNVSTSIEYGATYTYLDTLNDGRDIAFDGATAVATLDWAPLVITVPNAPTGQFKLVAGDVDHLRVLNPDELYRIHEAIMQSGMVTNLTVKD